MEKRAGNSPIFSPSISNGAGVGAVNVNDVA